MYRWSTSLIAPLLVCARSTAFQQHTRFLRHYRLASSSSAAANAHRFWTTTTHRAAMSSSSAAESSSAAVIPGRPTWQQTMIRIKDPAKSVKFYEMLGLTLVDTMDFPQYKFSIYFLTTLPAGGETYKLKPGTQAAHDYLWTMEGVCLELTHNHGTESDDDFRYHVGNEEKDGFGHVAVK